jgi:methanogenic corrinoid protein MtbC1
MSQELIERMKQSIVAGDPEQARGLSERSLREGVNPLE